ncbi:hypothetical protein DVH24_010298 [Malus domestica]|uniref:HAUS augmin-like complex subunit 3 N-terminal domain-containing protein n=1 Tax=Malus domestica TaxID=3750 RepID=A0A498JVJ8_MALDO|nr:hypothetical protein DVH24_010298 [Malus domestica]
MVYALMYVHDKRLGKAQHFLFSSSSTVTVMTSGICTTTHNRQLVLVAVGSFEWPFQYDDARPILDWICSSLRPSNVLSLPVLSQYEQFVQERKLLEGEDLYFAYDSISAFASRPDNQEAMNAVLGRMASTAQELAHYHSGDGDGIYSDFHAYLIGDSSFIKEPSIVEEGKSKCSWVSLEDISNVIVRADLEKSHHQRVSELQRLCSIFGTSERQWVETQVENAMQQAILMALKSQVSSDEAHIHLDLHSRRRNHAELVGELSNSYPKEEKLLFEVMRQEYYINRQKAFISHLLNQLARHQFLKMACQLEKKNMLGAYSLLKVIESEVQTYLSATKCKICMVDGRI